ncbi:MAG: DMT family transporter [candidate division WOR-3 bacterium]
MPVNFPYLGQTLALLSALAWAFAVILFKKSGETVHPIGLNLFKNLLAMLLLLPTMTIFGEQLLRPVALKEYAIFLLSGILGMAIGDTFFFMSLNRIGASLSAIVGYMYSPSIIILSVLFLNERLSLLQILGVILILFALTSTTQIKLPKNLTRKGLLIGILCGVLASVATAISVILIKPLLTKTPLLWATEIRLIAGFLSLLIITLFLPNRNQIIASLFTTKSLGYTLGGSLVGTYFTLVVWLGGMKYTQASIAAPLNQTSYIFVFILAAILLKEPITLIRLFAIIIAFSGALLVFLG